MASINNADRQTVSVADFVEMSTGILDVSVIAGDDALGSNIIDSPRVQKLGLALSGFADKIHPGRIQIFGNSERSYLNRFGSDEVRKILNAIDSVNISCILITADVEPSNELLVFAGDNKIPLLKTTVPSSKAISSLALILENALAPVLTMHGVMMEVFGIGVLVIGESGIGKSECALDLIGRGHRLISDDMVMIRRIGDRVFGEAPDSTRDHLEIRGLGILNARKLFGVSALARSAEIRLCIEFAGLEAADGFDRLGLEAGFYEPLGSNILKYTLPVSPGRNLATLVEAAVRIFVSRSDGAIVGDELLAKHDAALSARAIGGKAESTM